jgi:hypothetical protein
MGLAWDISTNRQGKAAMEVDLVQFRGLSLILQHRALVERLDIVEGSIANCQRSELTDAETAAYLLPLLRGFAQALPQHFLTESTSSASLLRDCTDADFARALQELDAEHPRLLAAFEVSVDQLAQCMAASSGVCHVSFEQAVAELLTAIGEFRRHEAREDALFAD